MKWLIRLIGLLLLVVVVVIGSLLALPGERLARIASDQLSSQLGRDVTITGDVSLSFYPVLGVRTGAITIANADWASNQPMFRAASADIALETLPLLRRDVRVKGLHADSPDILLQRDANGRANWQIGDAASGQAGAPAVKRISVETLTIDNGAFRFEDAGAAPVAYRNVDLTLRWPDPSGPAEMDMVLRPAGQDVNISTVLASPLNFLAGGAHPISARIRTDGGSANFQGKFSLAPEAQGKLTADLASTARFMAAFGLGAPDLPPGLGRAFALDTDLTLSRDQTLALRNLDANVDQNRLRGDIDMFLNGRPRVNGKLNAGDLDLSALGGGPGESAGGATWSTAPIDASALSRFDGELLIDAASLDLGTLKFGKSRILVTNDNSRAVFAIRELAGYDGSFSGQFVINNRNGLSVGGNLRGSGVESRTLLRDLTGTDRLSGKADAEIEFLGVGQSISQIVKSLSGKGAMKFDRGVIAGIDLDRLMRSGDGSGGTTIFDSLTATWDIASGVIRNNDLRLLLSALNADGDGKVNLAERSIDYTFTPTLIKTENRGALAIPVRISGPWSRPRISIDLEKAIDLNLKEERKAVEKAVETRVSEELGLDTQDGETLEDAARRKLESEVLNGLGGLLGGN